MSDFPSQYRSIRRRELSSDGKLTQPQITDLIMEELSYMGKSEMEAWMRDHTDKQIKPPSGKLKSSVTVSEAKREIKPKVIIL